MNILFVNDSTSNPNWGDRASSLALQAMIAAKGGHIIHRITEYALGSGAFLRPPVDQPSPYRPGRNQHWLQLFLPPAVHKLGNRLCALGTSSHRGFSVPERYDQFDTLRRKIMSAQDQHGTLLEAISAADAVVIHGNGSMVGNGVLPRAILFLCYLVKYEFAKHVILVNHTADFDNPGLLTMAQAVYPLLDDVVYRDRISSECWLDSWTGRHAPDAAFLFKPALRDTWLPVANRDGYFDVWPDTARFAPDRPYVCLGGSSLYSYDSETAQVMADHIALIGYLRAMYDGQIVLTASDGRDQRLFRPIAEQLKLPLVSLMTPVQQAIDIVGNASAYIGGRWHTSIFALRGGVPVIPVSAKTFKMQALASMADLPTPVFDARALDSSKQAIMNALDDCLGQGDSLRSRLREWSEQQAVECWHNVSFLEKGEHPDPDHS